MRARDRPDFTERVVRLTARLAEVPEADPLRRRRRAEELTCEVRRRVESLLA